MFSWEWFQCHFKIAICRFVKLMCRNIMYRMVETSDSRRKHHHSCFPTLQPSPQTATLLSQAASVAPKHHNWNAILHLAPDQRYWRLVHCKVDKDSQIFYNEVRLQPEYRKTFRISRSNRIKCFSKNKNITVKRTWYKDQFSYLLYVKRHAINQWCLTFSLPWPLSDCPWFQAPLTISKLYGQMHLLVNLSIKLSLLQSA